MSDARMDLVVLVADADMEHTVRTLLTKRAPALCIRTNLRHRVLRHPRRDPGVVHEASTFLRGYAPRVAHALVMLDWEGSGVETRFATPAALETHLENALVRNGWGEPERVAAVVLRPELEIWAWASTQHLAQVVRLSLEEVQRLIATCEVTAHGKPRRPKEALARVLRRAQRPHSPAVFIALARRVGLQRCRDRAFAKFRATLQRWFPPAAANPPRGVP